MEETVSYINELLMDTAAPFECQLKEGKGRILSMKMGVSPSEVLFEGPVLHKVSEDARNPIYIELTQLFLNDKTESLDYSPMWYWCALNSLSYTVSPHLLPVSNQVSKCLSMLYHPDIKAASPTIRQVVKAITPYLSHSFDETELIELDRLTVIWTLNCFEHADDPITYASFFLPSFMSHSCQPTAMWSTIGDSFFIRSQRNMEPGDELTVSYLSEEFGLRPISKRRAHLASTKFFKCDCPRCTAPVDDTRGFSLPHRLGLSDRCFVRYPKFDVCACGCGAKFSLSESEMANIINTETLLVDLVVAYDGGDDEEQIPTRTDPNLIGSDEAAAELEDLISEIGIFHWATARGCMQLAEYYKSIAMYPKAIALLQIRIESKRFYVKQSPAETSSSLAWSLEELGDIIMLHVSGSVVAGLSEEARERYCYQWKPKSSEDLETLKYSGASEAFSEAVQILRNVFGDSHEHTKTARDKLNWVNGLLVTSV